MNEVELLQEHCLTCGKSMVKVTPEKGVDIWVCKGHSAISILKVPKYLHKFADAAEQGEDGYNPLR